MKLIDVFKAREPLLRLTEKRFNNYKVLRQLVKARKAVESEVEFYAQEERKAVMQYAEKDEKGNPVILTDGRLKLVDAEAKAAFDETIAKLNDTEVDGIECIVIRENVEVKGSENRVEDVVYSGQDVKSTKTTIPFFKSGPRPRAP